MYYKKTQNCRQALAVVTSEKFFGDLFWRVCVTKSLKL